MIRIICIVMSVSLLISACSTVKTPPGHTNQAKKAPPGQVKKVTGSKSAAPYAPGQQKSKTAGKKKN